MKQRDGINCMAFLEKKISTWVSVGSAFFLFILWELFCRCGWISELFLPAPSSILQAGGQMLVSGELMDNLYASLGRIAMGFAIGSGLGVFCGMMIGYSSLPETLEDPVIHSLYSVFKIVFLPLIILWLVIGTLSPISIMSLIILWLGIGELSKIFIISFGVFFIVVINTYFGVRYIDRMLMKVAVSFKTSRRNLMWKVILPGALPMIFAGLKLAAGTSLLLLVAAEMIAAQEGIGAMILHYGDLMLTTKLMVGILTLAGLGVVFNYSLYWLERRCIPWKH